MSKYVEEHRSTAEGVAHGDEKEEEEVETIDEELLMKRDVFELKEKNEELKAKVARLEEAIKVKDDLLNIYKAKNETLEVEAVTKDNQIDGYKKTMKPMVKKLN